MRECIITVNYKKLYAQLLYVSLRVRFKIYCIVGIEMQETKIS